MSHHFIALVRRGATTEIAEQVEHDPEIAKSRDAQGVSALLWSVYSGQTVVRDFLLSGLDTLDIHEAAAVGDAGKLDTLLASHPSLVNSLSSDGWAPLHLAAAFGGAPAVKTLLAHGAKVDQIATSAMKNQPLHAALSLSNDLESIKLLIAAHADVNATQTGGYTPLHQAASAGKAEAAALLLAAGANPSLKCDRGKTPADYAEEKGHTALAERLRA